MRKSANIKIARTGGIITAVFFILFVLGLGYLSFFGERRTVSEVENREVKQMPELSLSSWVSGSFAGDYDAFVSDNFPWRDRFLHLNSRFNSYFTQLSIGDEGVWIGNRFLYKNRGMGHYVPTNEEISIYVNAINYVKDSLPETDVYVMLIPAAFNYYAPEKYQDPLTKASANIEKTFSGINNEVIKVNIYAALDNAKDDYIYFRTDYHWTARGAYCAYYVFAETAGFEAVKLERLRHAVLEGNYLGALVREMHEPEALTSSPDFVEVFHPLIDHSAHRYNDAEMTEGKELDLVQSSVNSSNKYNVFNGGDHPIIHIISANKNGRKILVIKDSFANPLTAFLVYDFEEVFFIDYRYLRMDIFSFIEEHSIDSLLFVNRINLDTGISEFIYMQNEV